MTSPPPTYDGFDAVLGFELVEASGDRVVGRLPVHPHLHQPHGIVHGGVWCSVVETTASVGGSLWFGDRGQVVGVSNHTNFLRAVREGVVEVAATPVQRGRTQQLWQVTCTVSEGSEDVGRLVAQGQVRLANLAPETRAGSDRAVSG